MDEERTAPSGLVDRVARAIYASDYPLDPDARDWEHIGVNEQHGYRDNARAAIDAMREPSDDMIAGLGKARLAAGRDLTLEEGYHAMIDAALSSSEPSGERSS